LHAVSGVDANLDLALTALDGNSKLSLRSLMNTLLCRLAAQSRQLKTSNENQLLLFANLKQVHADLLATGLVKSSGSLAEPIPVEDILFDDPDQFDTEFPEFMKMVYPLKTLDEVKEFNLRLAEKGNYEAMVKCLARKHCAKGGLSEDCAAAIYDDVFDTKLNWVMSWEGTKEHHLNKWNDKDKIEKRRASFKTLDVDKRIRQLFKDALMRGIGEKSWDPTKADKVVNNTFSSILRKSSTGEKASKERRDREKKRREKAKAALKAAEGFEFESESESLDGASTSVEVGGKGQVSEKGQKRVAKNLNSSKVVSDENAPPTASVASATNDAILNDSGPTPPTAAFVQSFPESAQSPNLNGSSDVAQMNPLMSQLLQTLGQLCQLPVGNSGFSHSPMMQPSSSAIAGNLVTSSRNVLNLGANLGEAH
jgi:hypothetical protein